MNLGEIIKTARKKKGVTHQQLADRIKIDRTYLSKIEQHNLIPSREIVSAISEHLDDRSILLFYDNLLRNKDYIPLSEEGPITFKIWLILMDAATGWYPDHIANLEKAAKEIIDLSDDPSANQVHYVEIMKILSDLRKQNKETEKIVSKYFAKIKPLLRKRKIIDDKGLLNNKP